MSKKVFEIGFISLFSSPKTLVIEEKNKMTIKYHDTEQLCVLEIDGYEVSEEGYLIVWGRDNKGWYWIENFGPIVSKSEE